MSPQDSLGRGRFRAEPGGAVGVLGSATASAPKAPVRRRIPREEPPGSDPAHPVPFGASKPGAGARVSPRWELGTLLRGRQRHPGSAVAPLRVREPRPFPGEAGAAGPGSPQLPLAWDAPGSRFFFTCPNPNRSGPGCPNARCQGPCFQGAPELIRDFLGFGIPQG
ncbi:PREDICTED: collagen alpha-1(I) chain-like [Tinamus guttatus]|uniref:collagen alpha-1(I) chain-like n=1 Tax=Tinamus guttatus TaxID=94827 RepID=UPI00052E7ACC|nr:PREDICTED: collagen alpha-1(I) chain-like [Tinamus guttatus]